MAFTKLKGFFTDTAQDIATKGFAEFFGDFVPSNAHGRELYKAANEVIEKKLTFASFLTNDAIRKDVAEKGLSGPEIEKAIDEFRAARATKDIGIATETAKRLDAKHGTAFSNLLANAEKEAKYRGRSDIPVDMNKASIKDIYIGPPDMDVLKRDALHKVYMNSDGENKIGKIVENFAADKMDKIDDAIYKANGLRNYFKNEDPKLNRKRAVGVGTAYVGTALIARAVKGGTPLKNEYGENDIAGVPFL